MVSTIFLVQCLGRNSQWLSNWTTFSTTQVKWRAVPAFSAEWSSKFAWRCAIVSTPGDVVYTRWYTSTFPSTVSVRRYLNRWYGEWWIGRGGPVPWPPRSSDLNLLDFCVWGYAKGLVYSTADTATPEELQYQILHAFQKMKNDTGLLKCIRGSMQRRLHGYIQVEGQHLESCTTLRVGWVSV